MKPMLSVEADPNKLVFPMMASHKLDGVRALVKNGVVLSRSLKPIPNKFVQQQFGKQEFEGFDGELIVGSPTAPDAYRKTVSGVMTQEGFPDVNFYLFDFWNRGSTPYEETNVDFLDKELNLSHLYQTPNLQEVVSTVVNNLEELAELESWYLDMGYEGVMLRSFKTPYKFGRSTQKEGYLLKHKQFKDSEAQILFIEELMHNDNVKTKNELGYANRSSHKENMVPAGTMGSLVVKDLVTEVEFKIGTGFDQETRDFFWKMKDLSELPVVKYKYFPSGSKDKPRFPTFVGLRNPIDL